EEEVRELHDVVAVREPVVAEDVAVAPELLDDLGGAVAWHQGKLLNFRPSVSKMRSQCGARVRTLPMSSRARRWARWFTLWYRPFCVFFVAASRDGTCRSFGISSTFCVFGSEFDRKPWP